MSETHLISERYERRKLSTLANKNAASIYYNYYIQAERELRYLEIITRYFGFTGPIKIIEIGAGSGGNLLFMKRIGFKWENIFANELLSDRIELLKTNLPGIHVFEGDACTISHAYNNSFEIVFQSTVFTSILDIDFKIRLATKMWDLVKSNGIILWYDFVYDNPRNKDVKGVNKKEIRKLFPEAKKITYYKTTLAPPIGRKVGKFYPLFNACSLLRTHLIAVIEK